MREEADGFSGLQTVVAGEYCGGICGELGDSVVVKRFMCRRVDEAAYFGRWECGECGGGRVE